MTALAVIPFAVLGLVLKFVDLVLKRLLRKDKRGQLPALWYGGPILVGLGIYLMAISAYCAIEIEYHTMVVHGGKLIK